MHKRHAEQAAQALKGILRTHVLALETRLGCRFPADHPMLSWMVEASADLITKHNRGPDGRTPHERLTGKPVKEEGFETIIVPIDALRYTQRNVQRQLCEGSRSGEIALVRSS